MYGQLIFDKAENNIQWKKVSLANGLGELDSNMQKNESRPLSYTIHKNKLEMDKGPECETGNHQNPRGESRKKTSLTSPASISYLTCLQRQGKQKQK